MYFDENLSASQIAQRLDLSKTSVLERLRKMGIRNGAGKLGITDPKNYRHFSAPMLFHQLVGLRIPDRMVQCFASIPAEPPGKQD